MMGLRKDRHLLTLFAPFKLGQIALKSRIVMASMTPGRTTNPGHVPNDLQIEYYRQRASAGLILTEGTWVSRDAIGFINVPGLLPTSESPRECKSTNSVVNVDSFEQPITRSL